MDQLLPMLDLPIRFRFDYEELQPLIERTLRYKMFSGKHL
jgi:hypothetical protein